MTETVKLRVEDNIGRITLANPEGRNTLTPTVVAEMHDALDTLDNLHCLVIGGSEQIFCAGGDIEGIVSGATGDLSKAEVLDRLERIDNLIERIYTYPAPTIAAIQGPAFGAGAGLAIACDLAVASETARIGFGSRRFGLPTGAGISALLGRIVSQRVARELIYTGELLEAEVARDMGLFNRVFQSDVFETELQNFVETIASGPTDALNESSRLLRDNRNRSLTDAMDAEREARARFFESANFKEGAEAFLDERNPEFDT